MRRQRSRNVKKEVVLPPLTDLSAFDVNERVFDGLLGKLCVELGFCIGVAAARTMWEHKPATIDEFIDALYAAEGMPDDTLKSLRRDVKSLVLEFIAARRATG